MAPGGRFCGEGEDWGDSYQFQGTPSYRMAMKLKALRVDLKKWNELEFENVVVKKVQLWSDLNALDTKEEVVDLLEEEKLEKARLQTEFKKISLLEEISWRQKSRMLYLKELFFHQMANSHRRNNAITNLKVDGVLTSDQKSIEVCFIQFYKNLFTEHKVCRPHLDVLNFPKISEDKAGRLVRPFDDVEVLG